MGSKILFQQVVCENSFDEVKEATIQALSILGGQINRIGNGFQVDQGKNGVQFGFAADISATVNIIESAPSKFDITCSLNWKMNNLSIICLIVGIFVFGILWIVPLLYLFVDPGQAYQAALNSIPFRLPSASK